MPEEYANLADTISTDDEWLSDVEDATDTEEDTGAAEQEQNEKEALEEKPAQTLKVKYNKEEREIDPYSPEAKDLLEKGLNYDKVRTERDSLRDSDAFKVLDAFAAQNGMTREEYVQFAAKHQRDALVRSEKQTLLKENPDAADELIDELAERRAAEKAVKIEQQQTSAKQAEWEAFANEYPGYSDLAQLPPVVQERVAAGETPVLAMRSYELAQARAKIAELEKEKTAEEQNKKNAEVAIGSSKSTNADAPYNAFLTNFVI
ncbi:MAG: hypothetical protein PHT58_03715 [Eubacteriales bacterium]|nr:hypothetical protein [Eubacteriales bacterium]